MTDNHNLKKLSFDELTKPYRHELLVHCYRLLGSIEDAEDGLQNTLLRAWKNLDNLRDESAIRAWLYRIATNTSLDMLKSRKTRSLPHFTHSPADPLVALSPPDSEYKWIDPLPDVYLTRYVDNPETQQETLEDISLAFLVVLQYLPGRQRAVLLLRDVLDWKAREVAETLNMTVAAVNSALQRARAKLKKYETHLFTADHEEIEDSGTAILLENYIKAWETADIDGLMALIHADAKLTMPPLTVWYFGDAHIQHFFSQHVFAGTTAGDFHLVPSRSNGSPAFLVYQRDVNDTFQLGALHILTIQDEKIIQIDDYLALDQPLFSRFEN